MKITLISPYPDIMAFGLRTLSAVLKKNGHATQMIFLPDPYGDDLVPGIKRYETDILDEVAVLCQDSDLIGITLMTNFFDGAVQITRHLKEKIKAPVLWGGVHPTIRPEESLENADMVCIGDGEEAILELVQTMAAGGDLLKIANIWVKTGASIVKNPPRPLCADLDQYPFPDYSRKGHYILADGRINPLDHALTEQFLKRGTVAAYLNKTGYQTMTGRGCPHKCAYCINDAIKNLYHGQGYLRWRSNTHVIQELLWVKENMPYVGYIWISDDAFLARPLENIQEFCREYKKWINLPFSCLASPLTVTEKKMEALVDAVLIYIQMGIQSGSSTIQTLFNRKQMNNERTLKAIKAINRFKDRMVPPSYDFILDVPYETDQDVIQSLRLIADIPKPYRLQPFALVLYPGTRLYHMAKADGFITDENKQIYSKSYTMRAPSYLNLLITLARGGHFPSALLRLLVSDPVIRILNSDAMKPFFENLYLGMKKAYQGIKTLVKR